MGLGVIDFETLYFNNDFQTKQLAISEFPVLLLANRQKDLNAVVDYVWKCKNFDKKGKVPDFYLEIFDVYNNNLIKGVSADDAETAKLLKNRVSRLAAAKTNYTIQLIERCKTDLYGVERTEEEYRKAAKVVINRANSTLAAEYNTTVHRSRVFKQWERFEREKHLFPHFKWLRTRSATPREVHLSYVGRIWRLDDPFLKNNHPGCTWNCKCDGTNTDEPVTENGDITPILPSPGLEGNPYYTKEIFSDKHPYFSRVEKHIPELGVLHNPDDIAYLNREDGGVKYQVHFNAQKELEEVNKPFLPFLKEAGYKDIKFLPFVQKDELELRKRYFGKFFQQAKCADIECDGVFVELKYIKAGKKARRNIIDQIGDADEKADEIMIMSEKQFDFEIIAQSQFKKYEGLKRIIFIHNKQMFDFMR